MCYAIGMLLYFDPYIAYKAFNSTKISLKKIVCIIKVINFFSVIAVVNTSELYANIELKIDIEKIQPSCCYGMTKANVFSLETA